MAFSPFMSIRPFALLSSCCLLVCHALAQDASLVPKLLADVKNATNDTARADALARICFNLSRSDHDSAQLVGEQALALATRINNQRALGDAHNNLGWLATEQGHIRRADSLLNIALSIFQRIGKPEYTSVALSNLGWLAEKKGDSVGSLKRFQEALTMSEQAKDTATASILHYSIGIAYRKIKDYPKALEHLLRSKEFERTLHRKGKEANCSVGLANTYRALGDTVSALAEFAAAAAMYASINDHQGAGIVEENLGDLLLETEPAAALPHFLVAKAHYDTLASTVDKAYVLLRIGTAQLRLKNLTEAETSFTEGLSYSAGAGDPNLVMEYERYLAELAKEQGDSEGVFKHYARYVALKDSLQGADTQNELARLRTEFETERTEKDNTILRAESNEKSERLRRKDIQLYGSVLIGALALVAALLFFRNLRQKQKHTQVLEGLNTRLANSNAEISEINGLLEMKLLRSQMNPHFIYNCLNSAARMTQAGQSVEALVYLQGFARLLRMVLDHSVNDTVGIAEEIDFLRQYLKLEAVRLEGLHYEVEADPALLDDDAELPALIVQPFVENAIWHGLANKEGERSLKVRFSKEGDGLLCTISDNGVGRAEAANTASKDPSHRSLGMQLTSERLRLLSRRMNEAGSIEVEDLRDGDGGSCGTRVTLRLADIA
jgi:tetratricopeptide (TPR) repeat protein/anti-sigma regulatory factor (Ser/Thr protein kinase)